MKREWLMAVLASSWVACATTTALTPKDACEQGEAWACGEWGGQLLQQGARQEADAAYGKACEHGDASSCMAQGRLRMEDGDLAGAEPPLRQLYEAGDEEGARALADLSEARGGMDEARRLRWEAPALKKPAFEFVFAYRASTGGGLGSDITLNIQPLGLFARRLTFGAQAAFNYDSGPSELNGFVGYQHFVSSWLVPYGRLQVGAASGLNVGTELGAKLCLDDLGHFNVAAGMSAASGGYVSVGLGLDGLLVLLMALEAL